MHLTKTVQPMQVPIGVQFVMTLSSATGLTEVMSRITLLNIILSCGVKLSVDNIFLFLWLVNSVVRCGSKFPYLISKP
jgi:hypothetical protein